MTTDKYTALRLTRCLLCKTVLCIEVTTDHHKDLRCGASFFVRHAIVICLELLERHAADVTCPGLFWLHLALADLDSSEGAKLWIKRKCQNVKKDGKWMLIVWFPSGIVEKRHVGGATCKFLQ